MPESLLTMLAPIAWPAAIALAWIAGEIAYRWASLPRISSYGIAGFAMAAGCSDGELRIHLDPV